MREIKFRAWNRIVGRWQYFQLTDLEKQKGAIQWQNLEIMQYTGLTDKNGKEIYEGDILRVPELYETPEMTATAYVNWEVVFMFGSWHLKGPDYTPELGSTTLYDEHHSYDEDFEVIGNIYENPELLKES